MDEDAEREALEAIVSRAKGIISQDARISKDRIPDPRSEAVFWRDSAMGLTPLPGEPVERKHRPGYVLYFDTPHGKYRFHADITTGAVRCDSRSSMGL